MKKLIAFYSVFLGISIIGFWLMILKTGSIGEGKTEISFHIFSELLMSVLCVLSGIKLHLGHPGGRILNIAAHSMVIYSVLNAAGYYGQRGATGLSVMFIVLMVVSGLILTGYLKES